MFDENQMVTYISRGKEVTKKATEISRGSHILLNVTCDSCGATTKRTWTAQLNSMEHNHGVDVCKKCKGKFINGIQRFDINKVRDIFEQNGCQLLSTKYHSAKFDKLRYIATCGHESTITLSHFKIGMGRLCKYCHNRGENNHSWRGGSSEINRYLRSLLTDWTQEQLKKANYTCEITGQTHGQLNVHHMVSFVNIRDITLDQLGLSIRQTIGEYTDDELQLLSKTFLQNNEILSHPIVMLESVHKDFHMFCGGNSHGTTFEQLHEFIKEYIKDSSIAS